MSGGVVPGVAHKDEGVSGKDTLPIAGEGVGVAGGERLGRLFAGLEGDTCSTLF